MIKSIPYKQISPSFTIFLLLLLLTSCGGFKKSTFQKYNSWEYTMLENFRNDTLGIRMSLIGRISHRDVSKKTSSQVKKQIVKSKIQGLNAKLLVAKRPSGKYFGYEFYSFVFDSKSSAKLNDLTLIHTSDNNAVYHTESQVMETKGVIYNSFLVHLKDNRSIIFIFLNELDPALVEEEMPNYKAIFRKNTGFMLASLDIGSH